MANCPNCGEQVKTGTNFCIVCGESLDSVVETVIPEVSKKNAITSFVLGIVAAEGVILSMFPYICFMFLLCLYFVLAHQQIVVNVVIFLRII